MTIILSAQNVTKRFGGLVAVNELTIDVKENSIYSVIGPNGAGKTTFFNCITGFYTQTSGEIIFNGHNIQGLTTDVITKI
jgi:branched-chain amino acid transport system ATP-binding protein